MQNREGNPIIIKMEKNSYISSPANDSDPGYIQDPLYASEQQLESKFKVEDSINILSKAEIYRKMRSNPEEIQFEVPKNTKSAVWASHDFRYIFYNQQKQKFVICMTCKSVLSYTGRTGTASLLRHKCEKRDRTQRLKLDNTFPLLSSSCVTVKRELMQAHRGSESAVPTKIHRPTVTLTAQTLTPIFYSNDEELPAHVEPESMVDQAAEEFSTADECLTGNEIVKLLSTNDPDLVCKIPDNASFGKYSLWDKFAVIYYKNVRQSFACCNICGNVISYKPKLGTSNLMRHKCKNAEIESPQKDQPELTEMFSFDNLMGQLFHLNEKTMQLLSLPSADHPDGTARVIQHIVKFVCKSIRSFDILNDENFVELVRCLLLLNAKDHNILYENYSEIVSGVKNILLPELEVQTLAALNVGIEADRSAKFSRHCLLFDLWTKSGKSWSLLWITLVTDDFYLKKIYVGSSAEKGYNPNFLPKLMEACGIEVSSSCPIVASDDSAAVLENPLPCILDSVKQIFVDFFNSIKSDEHFMQTLLFFYNYCQSQKSDSEEPDAAVEISLDLDFTIALSRSYSMHKDNITLDDGKADLDAFFQLVQNFIDCIESITSETNPTMNEVYLWKKKLEKVLSLRNDNKLTTQIKEILTGLVKSSFITSDTQKIAVFFDPNFKSMKFLDEAEKQEILSIVRSRFDHLKNEVSGQQLKKEAKHQPSTSVVETTHKFAEFVDIEDEEDEQHCEVIDYEMRRYIDLKLEGSVDMLEFWRRTTTFPNLKQLAKETLAIPACCQQNLIKYSATAKSMKEKCLELSQDEFNIVLSIHYSMK